MARVGSIVTHHVWTMIKSELKYISKLNNKFTSFAFRFVYLSRSFETMFLVTASEVVLGTAIIMGLSALVTILLRICSRPRYPRNTQTNSNVPDEFGRTGIRFSLSSLQQRVMSKLRDRPPRYETRHNYEYQRRETSTTRIPVLNPGAASMANNIPPPAYEPSSDNSSVSFKLQCKLNFPIQPFAF